MSLLATVWFWLRSRTARKALAHHRHIRHLLNFQRDRIFASVELQAMSKRLTVIDQESSPYAVVNLTLFSRELVKGLEASASLYNLFDQRYSHPVSDEFNYTGSTSGQPIVLDQVEQDGRGFRIKLTYRF